VYYDSNRGGNGFWDNYGQWILISSIMNNNNRNVTYVYPNGNNNGYTTQAPQDLQPGVDKYMQSKQQPSNSGSGFFTFLLVLLVIVVVVAAIYAYYKYMTDKSEKEYEPSTPSYRKPTPAPDTTSKTTDDSVVDFWKGVTPGSTVLLSDEESIQDNIKNGNGATPQSYVVKSVQTIKEARGLGQWLAFSLDGTQGELLLVAKITDSDLSLRVYYPSPDIAAGSRKKYIADGNDWLFQAPEDPDNYKPENLLLTAEIVQTTDGETITYVKKDDTYQAEVTESPAKSGSEQVKRALVTEYGATTQTQNPELMVLEVGSKNDESKSFITIYIGVNIRSSEVNALRASN